MAAADSVTTTAGLLQVLIGSPLERFLEWPQIDFVRPGAASLSMNLPVRFRDRINVEQPVLAALADGFGTAATQTLAIDTAVNHNMRHMDSGQPDEVSGFAAARWRHRAIEELDHICLVRRVHGHRLGAAVGCQDLRHDLLELAWRATSDQDVQALGRETPAQRCAQTDLCADSYHDCSAVSHRLYRNVTSPVRPVYCQIRFR